MRRAKNVNSCLFGEELVAYIYGELSLAWRAKFEDHLVDCSGCTAEFADISLSRLGVYEWHRDDFLPLETPQFVIPFVPTPVRVGAGYTWIEALRSFVVSPLGVAFAGSSLAVIAMAFVIVYVTTSDRESAGPEVGAIPAVVSEAPQAKPPEMVRYKQEGSVAVETAENRDRRAVVSPRTPTVVRAKAPAPKKRIAPVTTSARKAPRLGTFAEPEDSSLRLSDLVADIDTKDF